MDVAPACAAAQPLVHSWPFSVYWWLSLTAADQGAWVSGIGAFAASFVALLVAWLPRKWRSEERRSQALLIAKLIVDELDRARAIALSMLSRTAPFFEANDLLGAARSVEGYNFLPTSMVDKFVDRLDCFDGASLRLIATAIVGMKNAEGRIDGLRVTAASREAAEDYYTFVRTGAIESASTAIHEAVVALEQAIAACASYDAYPSKKR